MKARTVREIVNLQQSHLRQWYSISNRADTPAQVRIYDEIGFFGLTAQDFLNDVGEIDGPIDLHLSSPGGEVFDGIAIYNALRQRGGVTVMIDSLAASIASVIAMAADPGKLLIEKRGQMMIHDGMGVALGSAADMRELAEVLDRQSDNIAGIYSDRTGQPAALWREAMRAETWYTGEEAVGAGLADAVIGGTQNRAPAITGSWDGSAAMATCHSAADYRSICAGEKTVGEPDQAQHWALPHHDRPGAAPNPKGVSSALGYLPQTHDLKSESAARSHLEAHQRAEGGSDNHHDSGTVFDPSPFLSLLEEAQAK